jgi:MFS family permease
LVALAVSLGAATAQYGVSGWDPLHIACAAAGFAVLAVFAPRLLPRGTFRAARGLPSTVLLRGFSSGAYFALEAFVPLLLDTARRVPGVVTGLAFTGAATAWAAGSWFQGRAVLRHRRDRLVAVGALVLAGAVATACAATVHVVTPLAAAAALPFAAVGMGLLVPSLTVLSLDHVTAERQGYASSSLQTAQNLGQTTVIALATAVFEAVPLAFGGAGTGVGGLPAYRAAFALLLVPALLTALLAARAGLSRTGDAAA